MDRLNKVLFILMITFWSISAFLFFAAGVVGRDDDRSPSVLGGGVGGDAATLNSLNSGQFIRSDATDSYSSGTLTIGAGTTLQTEGNFYTKGSPVYNVKAYGAVGDGVADDTAEIAATVTACPVGGVVFIPAGDYLLSSPITINKSINLVGTGRTTILHQSADENLIELGTVSTVHFIRVEKMFLTSAATTAGKSLIYIGYRASRNVFSDLLLFGGYYGIYCHGAMLNRYYNITTDSDASAFAACSANQTWIYLEASGAFRPNNNLFYGTRLVGGVRGLHMSGSNSECGIAIFGGEFEGLSSGGVLIENVGQYVIIEGTHHEGGVDSGIQIVGCATVDIRQIYHGFVIDIDNSTGIVISGGYVNGVSIDKFSQNAQVCSLVVGASGLALQGSNILTWGNTQTASVYNIVQGGKNSPVPGRNLVDGDLEVWSGGLPIDFTSFGGGSTYNQEATIVKFGSSSAELVLGVGAVTNAYLDYALPVTSFRPFLTTYNNAVYRWILSASGTAEYYCELVAGGDPGIDVKPYCVVQNSVVSIEGTVGALAAGTWDYGDNDGLGYSTLYVRTAGDTDPDAEVAGYIQASHRRGQITVSMWAYKPDTTGVNPRIVLFHGGTWEITTFSIPVAEWTRCVIHYDLPSFRAAVSVRFGIGGVGTGAENIILDGIEVVEGHYPTALFDDKRVDAVYVGDGSVSDAELGYVNGVTSAIQTQIDSKVSISGEVLKSGANQGAAGAAAGELWIDTGDQTIKMGV
jgi:hypothetical protein